MAKTQIRTRKSQQAVRTWQSRQLTAINEGYETMQLLVKKFANFRKNACTRYGQNATNNNVM